MSFASEQHLGVVDTWRKLHFNWPIQRLLARRAGRRPELAYAMNEVLATGRWDLVRAQPHRQFDGRPSDHLYDLYARPAGTPPSASAAPLLPTFGLTFSQRQATHLNVPWQQAYGATLDLSESAAPGRPLGSGRARARHVPILVLDAQLGQAQDRGQAAVSADARRAAGSMPYARHHRCARARSYLGTERSNR
jgi:hypothetical protein